MTELPPDHPAPEPADTGRRRALARKGAREPLRIPRTRVRVSTVVLVVVFLVLLAIYTVTSVRYADESGERVTPTRTSEETVPTTAPSSVRSPSSGSTTTTPAGESSSGRGANSDSEESTAGSSITVAPGVTIEIPQIPGQQGDGQTQTETPQTTR